MRLLMLLLLAFALSSCADMPPQIVGPYASHLSAADIEQIKLVAADHCARFQIHVLGPPHQLTVKRPDYVIVDVPILARFDLDNTPANPQVLSSTFNVKKRRGHWVVDDFGSGSHYPAKGVMY